MLRLFLVFALAAAACQQPRPADPLPALPPTPELSYATLVGRVHDGNDLPVDGVTVTCAESDERYTTGPDGQYALRVPAGTTFTLRTYKPLYAGTTLTPMLVEPDRVVTGVDILVVPGPSIGAYNAQAGPDENRGVLAIQVVSLSGRCDASNATVTVLNPETKQPMPGALALYVRTGTSQPDRAVTAMQAGSKPNAWLVGVPEGQDFPVRFDKAGCAALPFPVVYQKATYQPGLRIAVNGLTQVPVFVE
jgi:hypothetical protein